MRKQQHSIREPLLIVGRKTTIVDEIQRGADVRTQIVHGTTPKGLRPERHMAIIRDCYYADEYEISAADFRQLRAMGALTEAEQVPVRARAAEQQPVGPLATANCGVADRYQDASISRPEVRCDPSRE